MISSVSNSQHLLLNHLQAYRKKYYLNMMIRGSLILLFLFSVILFVVLVSEALLGFSSQIRTGLFSFLVLSFAGILISQVIWPWTKMVNLTKSLSDEEIADHVRRHFPEIDDKLINLIELRKLSGSENALLTAAIEKKTDELAPVPFARAINLRLNWKYARFLLFPIFLYLGTFLFNSSLISDASFRIVNYDQEFLPPPPFDIRVKNHPDELISGQAYTIDASLDGDELPSELYMYIKKSSETDFISYPMTAENISKYHYNLENPKENFQYFIGNEEVKSSVYTTDIITRPSIKQFQVLVDYPSYTGLGSDTLPPNTGDLKAIKGSKISWILTPAGDVTDARWIGEDTFAFRKGGTGEFWAEKRIMDNESYYMMLKNQKEIVNQDTVRYSLQVLADRYPSVHVNAPGNDFKADHTLTMPLDFELSDDYGFTKLQFYYRFTSDGESGFKPLDLKVEAKDLLQHKTLEVNLDGLGMAEGDQVEYYLKVWDNDFVSGPKFTESSLYTINYPTLDQKYQEAEQNQENLDKQIDDIQKNIAELNESIDKFKQKTLNKKSLSYDDKQEMKGLMSKQDSVKEQIKELQENFEKNKEHLENNSLISEETLKKYEELNKFLEEIQSPELEKFMEKMKQEMDKMSPQEFKKNMDELEFTDEQIEKSIERTKELMKQLQVQQKIEEMMNKLDNLKEKQDILKEKTKEAQSDQEMKDIAEKQEKLNEEMKQIQEEMKELQEMKNETMSPDEQTMKELMEQSKDAMKEMENAQQKAGENQKGNSSDSQKKASDKMQEMMEKLSGMQMNMNSSQDQQNLEGLRDILENLLKLSFKQEDLRNEIKELNYGDPQMDEKEKEQKKLLDDMHMVKDSLDELAKKVFQIKKFVTDESEKILKSMDNSMMYLDNKQTSMVTYQQQLAMTSINNLANMLSDVLKQIQDQMKNQKPGQGMCQKPGGKQPNMQQLSEQQQQLNQQMMDMMKNGNADPQKLSEMAAQQEKIRQQLKEAHEQIQKQGGKTLGDMQQIMEDMKETENDLLNKNLTAETLFRQQKILNRLLDSQKAVREKEDFDDKRDSQTGKELDKKNPDELSFEEYKNKIRLELLKSNQLEYADDYMMLIEKYYKELEKQDAGE